MTKQTESNLVKVLNVLAKYALIERQQNTKKMTTNGVVSTIKESK